MKTIAQPSFNGAPRPTFSVSPNLPVCQHPPVLPSGLPAAGYLAPLGSLSSFNPALPEDGALIIAEVLRGQFIALNDDIQTRATEAELGSAVSALEAEIAQRVTQAELTNGMNIATAQAAAQVLPQTSNVTNGVSTLSVAANVNYDQWQMQQVIDKIDELINALRR